MHLRCVCLLLVFRALLAPEQAAAQCAANAGSDLTICQGQTATLGGNPTAVNAGGGVGFDWSGATTDVANPVVSPSSTTTYTITLVGGNCPGATDQITVTVLPAPQASFTFSPATACAGVPVQFSNATSGCSGCTYAWNFDNPASGAAENTSTAAQPAHAFVSAGNGSEIFTVSLTVTSSNGCQDTHVADINISQSPNAQLNEGSNFTQCLGIADFYTYVSNSSSGTVQGSSYQINWGDGSPVYNSTTPPDALEHIYSGVNIWMLQYTVTNPNGCSDQASYEVTNISNPAIGTANPGNTLQCGPVDFCFPLSSYGNNHVSTVYTVDFGDGSPTVTYPHPPPVQVCHTYSESSCANSPQFFTFSITADNNCTPSTNTVSPIQIFVPPAASFSAPAAGCVGVPIPFSNTSVPGYNLSCGSNTSYSWNFGDPASGPANTSTSAHPSHTFSAPGTYTVTLTATNAGNPLLACGTTTFSQQICIEQPPSPVFSVNDNDGCLPMTVITDNLTPQGFASCNTTSAWVVGYSDLPCDPDDGSYSYAGGTGPSSAEPQFLLQSVGVYTIRLQMSNSCGVFQDQETITVNTVPVVSLSPLSAVCAGQSVTPSASVDGCNLPVLSYSWQFPQGTPSTSVQLSPGPVSYPSQGSYPVSLTATNQCGAGTASTTVSVLNPPNVQVTSGNPGNAVCVNGTIQLTASNAATYQWSPSTGLSSTAGSVVSASPQATTTYTVTGTTGTCTDTETITVIVHPLPVVSPSGTFTMCAGETEQLGVTVSGGQAPYSGYAWSDPSSLNNASVSNPVSSAPVSTNYTVQVTDANGCPGTGLVPLTVHPLPVTDAGPDLTLCSQPVPTSLTGQSPTSGGTGAWSGPGVTPAGVFTPGAPGAVSLTYCFTSGATGCSACDVLSIQVVSPTPAQAGPDITACLNGATLQLPAGGVWSGSPQVSPSGLFTPSVSGPVTLTLSTGAGSCQQTDQAVVNVLPAPVTNAMADLTVCAGTPVQLNASAASPNGAITGYFWSGGTVSNPMLPNPTAAPGTTTTFNVTAVDAFGCSDEDQVTIFVNVPPVVNAGPDITLCNQPIPHQLAPVAPTSGGTWSGPGVSSAGVFTPFANGLFTLTYSYTSPVTSCTAMDNLVVNVISPTVANAGPDVSVCQGAPAIQLAPPVGGGTWSPAPVTSSGQFSPSAPGNYLLTYSIGSGTCLSTDQLLLTVHALPSVQAGQDLVICQNETVQLNAQVSGGQGPYSYSWSPAPSLDNPATGAPVASPAVTTSYTVSITDSNGCQSSDQVQVSVNAMPVVNAGNDITLCDQAIPHILTGFSPASGGTGMWSGSGILQPSGTFLSPGTGTYWLYYTFTSGGNGCGATDSIQVTVQPPVFAMAGPDLVLCLNDAPVVLQGFPAQGLGWSGTGVTGPDGTFNPAAAGAGVFSLTATFGSGTCQTSDEVQVTVQALPAVQAGPDESVCGNEDGLLPAGYSPSAGGLWEGAGVTDAATGWFDPSIGPGSYTLLYAYVDPFTGCADTAFKQITVHPVPDAQFNLPPQGCTNAPSGLVNLSSGATVYTWTFGNGDQSAQPQPVYTYPLEGWYDVTLVAANAFGCSDTAVHDHEVIDPPQAAFSLSSNAGCGPLGVQFENHSVGQYLDYSWDLAIGSSTLAIPDPVVYPLGTDVVMYPVSLTVSNSCGSDVAEEEVTVYPAPVAGFGTDLDVFCSPFTVNLNNTSTGNPDSFLWDFGDGSAIATMEEPGSHTFFADSVVTDYTITLILSNECGADTADYTITVLPNTVTAFFNTSTTEGCTPLTVAFTDYSEGGTQIQYHFGDGNFTGDPNPVYTFQEEGVYTIYQYVDNGCSYDTASISVEVYGSPDIDFTTDIPFACGGGEEVQFISDPGDAISLVWDFGDGSGSSISNPQHVFPAGNTYLVTLTGEGDNGCTSQVTHPFTVFESPMASFAVPELVGCSPFALCPENTTAGGVFYSWDFGDGNTANGDSPCHTFFNEGAQPVLRTISLVAQNLQLCADTFQLMVVVSPQPVSAFVLDAYESCDAPAEVWATNQSQYANGYTWLLDGAEFATTNQASFAADDTGTYTITLVASNAYGCSDQSDEQFVLHPRPQLDFDAEPRQGCVSLPVSFVNFSSGGSAFEWDFGDGSTSTAEEPTHEYDEPGVYDVTLAVSTDMGCTDTLVLEDFIMAYGLPVADFWFTPESATVFNPSFSFYNNSMGASAWLWNLGDGTQSGLPNTFHTYAEAGSYTVELQVWNAAGCTDIHQAVVWVEDRFNVYVPNAFTPDNDGINDVFRPEISGTALLERYSFEVFDRWGTVIFKTEDPDLPWTGSVREGDYFAKDDAYNWRLIVKVLGEEENRPAMTGHVLLIR